MTYEPIENLLNYNTDEIDYTIMRCDYTCRVNIFDDDIPINIICAIQWSYDDPDGYWKIEPKFRDGKYKDEIKYIRNLNVNIDDSFIFKGSVDVSSILYKKHYTEDNLVEAGLYTFGNIKILKMYYEDY